MKERKATLAMRAGVVLGMAAGFCFASGVFLLVNFLRAYDRNWAIHPARIYVFGIVPLFWFVWGLMLLKKVEAAD